MQEKNLRQQFLHNNTTFKHLNSRRSFEVTPIEKEDDQIDVQNTLTNTFKNINTAIRYSPDRQMLKQIRSFDLTSEHKVRVIADQYYNYAIFQKTNSFLDDIKRIILSWEEKLRIKRKQNIQQTTLLIRQQWAQINEHLIKLVSRWCSSCEKYEIGSFLERGQLKMDGALIEILSRLGTKREEIEQHIYQMETLTKDQAVLKGQELTSHMKQVKNYYKHIWNKDYEFQIESLEKECVSRLNKSYIYEKIEPESARFMKQQFKGHIDRLFQEYFHVNNALKSQTPKKDSSDVYQPERSGQNEERQYSFKQKKGKTQRKVANYQQDWNEYNQQQKQSINEQEDIAQKRRQIQRERLQRDKEWIILVQNLDK